MRFQKQQLAANVPPKCSIAKIINVRKYVYFYWFFVHASRTAACKQAVFEQRRSTAHAAQGFLAAKVSMIRSLQVNYPRAS